MLDAIYGCDSCRTTIGRAGCEIHRDRPAPTPGVNLYITTCVHGVDLRFVPRCYLCRPEEPLAALAGHDYTDLLLLIAECLVPLAFAAAPDGGRRQSRLESIAKAYREDEG